LAQSFDTLDAWLGWLETQHPREIELGLERIRQVARKLDLLKPRARVVSVAGTNGKGSCVAATAALLRRAGLNVGSYTSPHLLRYNERVQVNAEPVDDRALCLAFERIAEATESLGLSLTYFEFGTLAALEIFRRRQVDIMVLEVGLGGRLDAVNLLDADASVVTSVDLDHQDWLGTDREAIGREKAGIFRAGKPALCADTRPPQSLVQSARALGAQWQPLGHSFGFQQSDRLGAEKTWSWWGAHASGQRLALTDMPAPALPLPSLAAALQLVAQLGYDPQRLQAPQLLAELELPGRYQKLPWRDRTLVLDVAHNPAAARYLAQRLAQDDPSPVVALLAMMKDKDRRATISALAGQVAHWWLADLPQLPRSADSGELRVDLESLGRVPLGCGTVAEGLEQLWHATQTGDRIVILGSFHTLTQVYQYLDLVCPYGETP